MLKLKPQTAGAPPEVSTKNLFSLCWTVSCAWSVLSAPTAATAKINKNKRRIISKFTVFDYWAEFAAAVAAVPTE